MVVVGSVYEKNKIIKDPDQEIYAHHFDRLLIRKLSLSRFAQVAHQACCEPVKITAKFSSCFSRPLFIFYHIPEGYSAEPTIWWEFERDMYGERYWLIIFVFINQR